MADKTSLGDRMKSYYENRTRYKLTRRQPVIIRIDGKAFHTYTRGLDKPFDEGLMDDMVETTKFLCKNIMGAKCGYTQSDEISILITDFDKLETQAWFDYNLQKMCSIAASLATAKFNQLRAFRECSDNTTVVGDHPDRLIDAEGYMWNEELLDVPMAYFDARVFQIPEAEEVVNYFVWRQQDAVRNSISMLAQSLYSHNELNKKNTSQMQDMCWEKGQNWNDLSYDKKRGSFIVKIPTVNGNKLPYLASNGDYQTKEYNEDNQPNFRDGILTKEGRYLEWVSGESNSAGFDDWTTIPDPSIRNYWEAVETPHFSKDRNSILTLINYKK